MAEVCLPLTRGKIPLLVWLIEIVAGFTPCFTSCYVFRSRRKSGQMVEIICQLVRLSSQLILQEWLKSLGIVTVSLSDCS